MYFNLAPEGRRIISAEGTCPHRVLTPPVRNRVLQFLHEETLSAKRSTELAESWKKRRIVLEKKYERGIPPASN